MSRRAIARMRQQDAAERRNQRPGVRRHDADERRASPAGRDLDSPKENHHTNHLNRYLKHQPCRTRRVSPVATDQGASPGRTPGQGEPAARSEEARRRRTEGESCRVIFHRPDSDAKRIPPPIAGEQWLYRSTEGLRNNSAGTPEVIQVQIAGHEMK